MVASFGVRIEIPGPIAGYRLLQVVQIRTSWWILWIDLKMPVVGPGNVGAS
jgi:hypothetical protein